MYKTEEIMNILFDRKFFWDREAFHEAKILFIGFYESHSELRELLIDKIIEKSVYTSQLDDDKKIGIEFQQFDTLATLNQNGIPIFNNGTTLLKSLIKKHPDWAPKPKDNITEIEANKKDFNIMTPIEIYRNLVSEKEDDFFIKRQSKEMIGIRCSKDFEFCINLFKIIEDGITEFPINIMAPIIWGLTPQADQKELVWSEDQLDQFAIILDKLIEKRPIAELWHSLPSLLERIYYISKRGPLDWKSLFIRISELLIDFEHSIHMDDEKPVEWMQQAVNHPFGKLTEIYLSVAFDNIQNKKQEGIKLSIEQDVLDFLEFTVNNYGIGSRYGLCLISRYLSWFETVEYQWTNNNLLRFFNGDGDIDNEQKIVAWSGYLWSNSLSKSLIQNFENTYKKIVFKFNELGRDEKRGFNGHISYIFWSQNFSVRTLFVIINEIDKDNRCNLVNNWQEFIEKSEIDKVENFWDRVLIPLWKWSGSQQYFSLPEGNADRICFWGLVPYSYSRFPQVIDLAIRFSPQVFKHPGFFMNHLKKNADYFKNYQHEFVEFLIAFINVDQNPIWQKDDWLFLLDRVKSYNIKRSDILKNLLAEKGLL